MSTEDSIQNLVRGYCRAWGEPDKFKREALLRTALEEDVLYIDPHVQVLGVTQLSEHIETVFSRYPESTIAVTSEIDVHHGFFRFAWHKILADGTFLPEGVDFCRVSPNGKIAAIVGFFGPLHPLGVSEAQ